MVESSNPNGWPVPHMGCQEKMMFGGRGGQGGGKVLGFGAGDLRSPKNVRDGQRTWVKRCPGGKMGCGPFSGVKLQALKRGRTTTGDDQRLKRDGNEKQKERLLTEEFGFGKGPTVRGSGLRKKRKKKKKKPKHELLH